MNAETAINTIDNVRGFDDETSSVGEAWGKIKLDLYAADEQVAKFKRLAGELAETMADMVRYLDNNGKESDVSELARDVIDKARQEGVIE